MGFWGFVSTDDDDDDESLDFSIIGNKFIVVVVVVAVCWDPVFKKHGKFNQFHKPKHKKLQSL